MTIIQPIWDFFGNLPIGASFQNHSEGPRMTKIKPVHSEGDGVYYNALANDGETGVYIPEGKGVLHHKVVVP